MSTPQVRFQQLISNITTGPVPKRAKELLAGDGRVKLYKSTGGEVIDEHAAHNVGLMSPIPAGAVIHDNCAGAGTVTKAIIAADPPSDVKIYAADIDQLFLDNLKKEVAEHSWPVEVSNQASETLNFPDSTFTHSISNFGVIFTDQGGLAGAREMFRTLKPGGTAVVSCWENTIWFAPFKTVSEVTRPGKPWPSNQDQWKDGERIQQIMVDAGFSMVKVERSEAYSKMKAEDLRDWAEKAWAFLGGMAGWQDSDNERWDEAVDLLTKSMLKEPGTERVGDEVRMHTSQWVVVATK